MTVDPSIPATHLRSRRGSIKNLDSSPILHNEHSSGTTWENNRKQLARARAGGNRGMIRVSEYQLVIDPACTIRKRVDRSPPWCTGCTSSFFENVLDAQRSAKAILGSSYHSKARRKRELHSMNTGRPRDIEISLSQQYYAQSQPVDSCLTQKHEYCITQGKFSQLHDSSEGRMVVETAKYPYYTTISNTTQSQNGSLASTPSSARSCHSESTKTCSDLHSNCSAQNRYQGRYTSGAEEGSFQATRGAGNNNRNSKGSTGSVSSSKSHKTVGSMPVVVHNSMNDGTIDPLQQQSRSRVCSTSSAEFPRETKQRQMREIWDEQLRQRRNVKVKENMKEREVQQELARVQRALDRELQQFDQRMTIGELM